MVLILAGRVDTCSMVLHTTVVDVNLEVDGNKTVSL